MRSKHGRNSEKKAYRRGDEGLSEHDGPFGRCYFSLWTNVDFALAHNPCLSYESADLREAIDEIDDHS